MGVGNDYPVRTTSIKGDRMTRPSRIEINCETGVESIIELTDAEVAQMQADAAAAAERQAEEDAAKAASEAAKASAQAKLAALGLTQEEITALTK
jgi:hypothetical protein